MRSQELATLGSTLVILGIIFAEDRFIGYSFIGVGVSLSLVSAFKLRRKPSAQRQRAGDMRNG